MRHQSSMQSWAAPICDIVRAAHRGQFDADALRDVDYVQSEILRMRDTFRAG